MGKEKQHINDLNQSNERVIDKNLKVINAKIEKIPQKIMHSIKRYKIRINLR